MPRELIRYREEFKPDVVRLLTEFWPSPADSAAQFTWLQESNPFTESPLVYLALVDGQVVGMRGFYGARWEIAGTGQVFDAPCGNMFVVDAVARGQGLASFIMQGALDDLAARGYDHVLSLSARPIPYISQLRSGWRPVVNYHPQHRETREAQLRRVLRERVPGLRRAWRRVRRRRPSGKPKKILGQRSPAFGALEGALPSYLDGGRLQIARKPNSVALAELARAAMPEGRIRHVRTAEYFTWRYRAPLMGYRFLTWSDGADQGVLVLETGRGARGWTSVVDWQVTSVDVLERLVGAVIQFGKFHRIWTWRAGLPDEMEHFLHDHGFVPSDETFGVADYEPGMMVKALADGGSEAAWEVHGLRLDEATNWSLRPSYSI